MLYYVWNKHNLNKSHDVGMQAGEVGCLLAPLMCIYPGVVLFVSEVDNEMCILFLCLGAWMNSLELLNNALGYLNPLKCNIPRALCMTAVKR